MKVALTRVDSRLVHGQVIEDWVPAVGADVVIVANDEVASDPLQMAIMESCTCSADIRVRVVKVDDVSSLIGPASDGAGTAIVLLRDVQDARRLWNAGVHFTHLNLGNVHEHPGSRQVSRSVALNDQDVDALKGLATTGVAVEIRAVSRDRSLALEEVIQ